MMRRNVLTMILLILLASAACAAPPSAGEDEPDAAAADEGVDVSTVESPVTVLRFLPDGSGLISGHADGSLVRRDAAGVAELVLAGHNGAVVDVAVSPDGAQLVSTGEDNRTLAHRLDGSATQELANTLTRPNSVHFSPDGATLAEAYWEKLELWSLDDLAAGPQEVDGLEPSILVARFAPDGAALSLSLANTGLAQPAILHLDPASGEVLRSVTPSALVEEMIYAGDGTRFAAVTEEGVDVWPTAGDTPSFTLPLVAVRALAFDPAGATLSTAAQSGDGLEIARWDLESGAALTTRSEAVAGQVSAAFAPDASAVAIGSEEGDVVVLALEE